MPKQRLQAALDEIDNAHRSDPQKVETADGPQPAELIYAQRMTAKLNQLVVDPSHELQLAVRSQHLRRWQLPRENFPMDRVGYLKWRTELKNLHARELGEIMARHSYDQTEIARAQSIVKKERIKSDPETQSLEDTACLVFLEYEFAEFAAKHEREKIIDIVRKTWAKMSSTAQSIALKLQLSPECTQLVHAALTA